jgi:DHA3 family macrolide efflux protein-like MFS transporter
MIIQGLSLPLLNTPATTSIQELIPSTMMGRVMGFTTLVNTVCGPVGMAVFGPLADRVSLSWLAFACGGVSVLILVALVIRGGPGSRLMAPDTPDKVQPV